MAVINTGIVERTIVGVNESDLFLDSEATSVTTNTGIVERSIVGVHDANFVHPLGDEEILNGDFSNGSTDWTLDANWSIAEDKAVSDGSVNGFIRTSTNLFESGKTYKVGITVSNMTTGQVTYPYDGAGNTFISTNGDFSQIYYADSTNRCWIYGKNGFDGSIDNISVKEVLVNRESTTTNTGVVERPITGVNESDALFPDNTESTVVNISDTIIPLLTALEARATTFENREGTQNILINLQKC